MPLFKTLHFDDSPKGQREKVRVLEKYTADGWRLVSETITPGRYDGGTGCCLALICLPLGFLAPKSQNRINVTLQLD